MQILIVALGIAVPLAYAATLWTYVRLFRAEDEADLYRRCSWALAGALALHTCFLGAVSAHYGRCPLTTAGEGVVFAAWLLAMIQLVSERFTRTQTLGVFTLIPALLGVCLGVFLHALAGSAVPEPQSALLVLHIAGSVTAYICYFIAAVMAAMYVVLHRRLKRKQFDLAFRKIPPLEELDRIAAGWVLAGSLLLISAGIMGWAWMRDQPDIQMGLGLLPIYVVLLIFLASGAARRLLGWRGLRHILLVLAGFAALVIATLLSFMEFHGFYS